MTNGFGEEIGRCVLGLVGKTTRGVVGTGVGGSVAGVGLGGGGVLVVVVVVVVVVEVTRSSAENVIRYLFIYSKL